MAKDVQFVKLDILVTKNALLVVHKKMWRKALFIHHNCSKHKNTVENPCPRAMFLNLFWPQDPVSMSTSPGGCETLP